MHDLALENVVSIAKTIEEKEKVKASKRFEQVNYEQFGDRGGHPSGSRGQAQDRYGSFSGRNSSLSSNEKRCGRCSSFQHSSDDPSCTAITKNIKCHECGRYKHYARCCYNRSESGDRPSFGNSRGENFKKRHGGMENFDRSRKSETPQ